MLTLKNRNKLIKQPDRSTYIGGSDIAAICGQSQWKTPLDIYNSKKFPEKKDGKNSTFAMRFGSFNEPFVLSEYKLAIDQYQQSTGVSKIETGIISGFVMHEFYPFGAQLDGYYTDKEGHLIVVEAKTANYHSSFKFGSEGSDEIPPDYLFQCAWQAILTGAHRVDLPVVISGSELKIYHYFRNSEFEQEIIKKVFYFYDNYFLKDVPPPPCNLADLKAIYPESNGNVIEVNYDVMEKAEKIMYLKEEIKKLQVKLDEHELQIKKTIASNDAIKYGGKIIATLKNQERKYLDVAKVREVFPEIYNECEKTSTIRVLRLKTQLN